MGHKHAELYKQMAKDAETSNRLWEFWQVKSANDSDFVDCTGNDYLFAEYREYRRKPETVTITVNGRELVLPKWETKALEEGQEYYSMSGCMEKGYDHFVWNNDCFDKTLLQNKLVLLSEEHVIEWVKLWKFMTGGGK